MEVGLWAVKQLMKIGVGVLRSEPASIRLEQLIWLDARVVDVAL
jgi:hypothetical protein